mmetsp:Transcript_23253/g.58152  ORF Transcript_23253/g.58152 Transcript_23253/m.58152 type:complete len:207 (-) Transcript_23253:25-645(-)
MSGKVSTRKGGKPKGPPAHQNTTAWKHNRKSKKTAYILSLNHHGLCQRCNDIIEWKKQYRKYKPLKAPRKCRYCQQPRVLRAYHVICDPCVKETRKCAKCEQSRDLVSEPTTKTDEELMQEEQDTIKYEMTERQRRAYIRKRQDGTIAAPWDEAADEEAEDDSKRTPAEEVKPSQAEEPRTTESTPKCTESNSDKEEEEEEPRRDE